MPQQNDVLQQLDPIKLQAALYKKSFYKFYKEAFKILEPGVDYMDSWFIKYLCDELQSETERIIGKRHKAQDLIINVPPRSSKSLIISVVWPVWCWVRDPRLKFICASYSSSLSLELSVKSRDLLQSDWFKKHFPEVQIKDDSNTKSDYKSVQGGARVSTSVGGTLTGKGCNIMILDDVQDPEQASSEAEIKRVQGWYTGTAYNRVNNPKVDLRVIVQQRLNVEDLTGYLLSKSPDGYRHICLPVEQTKDVKPAELVEHYKDGLLWPERFDRTEITKLKKQMGSAKFAGQYLQTPVTSGGGMFKENWFKTISVADFSALTKDKKIVWNVCLDCAETEKAKNDATAILVYTYFQNTWYIKEVLAVRKEFVQLVSYLKTELKKHIGPGSKIFIEGKSSGKSVISLLKRETTWAVIETQPGKEHKTVRLEKLTPDAEAGRFVLIKGAWNDSFIEEATMYPGKHDDQLDALYYAWKKKAGSTTTWATI